MAGTREGAAKAKEKNLANDPNFYQRIGKIGGSRSTPTGGFASLSKEEHLKISAKGGRGKKKD